MDLNSPLAVALGLVGGMAVVWRPYLLVQALVDRRDQRRFAREQAARERRQALDRQLRALEDRIREEPLGEEERAWHRPYRQRRAEITREARRRLGLPEEDEP
jgi:hypothetical protein